MKTCTSKRANIILLTGGIILPLVVFLISLCIGRYPLAPGEMLKLLISPLTGQDTAASSSYVVFWLVRFPRAVLVLLAGGALALAGTLYQNVMRNPLVSPDILGVSAGASLGAAFSIVVWNSNPQGTQFAAFSGGIVAVFIAFNLAKLARGERIVGLILAGVIISSLASSGVTLLKYLADPLQQLPAIEYWIMGGFYTADWELVRSVLPSLFIATGIILSLRWQINVLSLGEEEALALGVRVPLLRGILVTAATILVASVVSVAGIVSWIGLVVPHIVRTMVGNDCLKSIPLSISVGGIVLLTADTLARTITTSELPISILTSMVGAPFLAYLLWNVGKGNSSLKKR